MAHEKQTPRRSRVKKTKKITHICIIHLTTSSDKKRRAQHVCRSIDTSRVCLGTCLVFVSFFSLYKLNAGRKGVGDVR